MYRAQEHLRKLPQLRPLESSQEEAVPRPCESMSEDSYKESIFSTLKALFGGEKEEGKKFFKYLLIHGFLIYSFLIHNLLIHNFSICNCLIHNRASLKPLEKVELRMMKKMMKYIWPATKSYPSRKTHRLLKNHEHMLFLPIK